MTTPARDEEALPLLSHYFQSRRPSSTLSSTPSPLSTQSLSLWSRKLALQSEELTALLQSSTAKLHEDHKALSELLTSCKADITTVKQEIETISKRRDEEVDSHITALRRISQTSTDLLSNLSGKLSLLENLPILHGKLHSHDLLFGDLVAKQKGVLCAQEEIGIAISGIAVRQDEHTVILEKILRVLSTGRGGKVEVASEVSVKDLQPQSLPRKRRRLLSDEGVRCGGSVPREVSVELLGVGEKRGVEIVGRELRSGKVIFMGKGGEVLERPLKRKLLSTLDVEQFEYAD